MISSLVSLFLNANELYKIILSY